jgi:hypothetical protein
MVMVDAAGYITAKRTRTLAKRKRLFGDGGFRDSYN